MFVVTGVVSECRDVLVVCRLVSRYIDSTKIKLFTLVPGLSLHELGGDVCPVAHTALHDSLHESQSLLRRPLSLAKRVLERVIDEVLTVSGVINTFSCFAL